MQRSTQSNQCHGVLKSDHSGRKIHVLCEVLSILWCHCQSSTVASERRCEQGHWQRMCWQHPWGCKLRADSMASLNTTSWSTIQHGIQRQQAKMLQRARGCTVCFEVPPRRINVVVTREAKVDEVTSRVYTCILSDFRRYGYEECSFFAGTAEQHFRGSNSPHGQYMQTECYQHCILASGKYRTS